MDPELFNCVAQLDNLAQLCEIFHIVDFYQKNGKSSFFYIKAFLFFGSGLNFYIYIEETRFIGLLTHLCKIAFIIPFNTCVYMWVWYYRGRGNIPCKILYHAKAWEWGNNMTTLNKVEKMELTVNSNFSEAQRILDAGDITSKIDADCAFNFRVPFEGVGTYPIQIERKEDFWRFENKMQREQGKCRVEIRNKKDKIFHELYQRGLTTQEETIALMNVESQKLDAIYENGCSCKPCNFTITFEEWKSGKMANGAKVGKSLRKAGFSQELLDFYSLQSKEETFQYLTVSDRVQHIAGMSFYSNLQWDGYNDSSCQDPRWDYSGMEENEGVIQLAGSLHDNKLFIAFLHENIEDLDNMDDMMIARSIMRYITIDGKPALVACQYYGNNNSKDELHNALEQLSAYDIYPETKYNLDYEELTESANGFYSMTTWEEIRVSYEVDEYVDTECPTCEGSGEMEYDGHDIECCTCEGSGTMEVHVYKHVREWKEVEKELEIEPYAEGYYHYGRKVEMDVNVEKIRQARNSR